MDQEQDAQQRRAAYQQLELGAAAGRLPAEWRCRTELHARICLHVTAAGHHQWRYRLEALTTDGEHHVSTDGSVEPFTPIRDLGRRLAAGLVTWEHIELQWGDKYRRDADPKGRYGDALTVLVHHIARARGGAP